MKKISIPNPDFVKKNLWSLLCGLVVIIAIVALFYPLGSKKEKLQQDLDQHASGYQALQQLLSKPRTLPIVDPAATTPQPLPRFPNQQLIDQAGAIPKAFAADAQAISTAALKLNQHELLVPDSLPRPTSNVVAFDFRDAYQRIMAKDGGLVQMLHAGHPPTADEIAAAQNDLWMKQYVPQLVYPQGQSYPNGTALNQQEIQAAFDQDKISVPLHVTEQVAATSVIYMDPTALWVSPAASLTPTGSASAPSPEEIWYAQLGVWMQQDVIQAILRTNAGYKNVTEAPAKRLIKIAIDARPYLVPPTYAPGQLVDPPSDDKTAVTKDIHVSMSGRLCNAMYDVMHFDIIINVAADKIPWLLAELSDKQFITVLKCDVKPVDSAVDQTQGYIYGPQPVAQLHLVCEEVYLRDWDRKFMPKEVAGNLMGVSTVGGGSAYTSDMGGDMGGASPPPPGAGPGRF